jgi:Xaa-Pro dipeptidase
MTTPAKPDLKLDPRLMAIVAQEYPRFSAEEMVQRRTAMGRAMAEAGVDHLVVYGAGFRGGPVHWLCDWPTTTEAVLVFTPHERDTLLVQYYNHVPLAVKFLPYADVR